MFIKVSEGQLTKNVGSTHVLTFAHNIAQSSDENFPVQGMLWVTLQEFIDPLSKIKAFVELGRENIDEAQLNPFAVRSLEKKSKFVLVRV